MIILPHSLSPSSALSQWHAGPCCHSGATLEVERRENERDVEWKGHIIEGAALCLDRVLQPPSPDSATTWPTTERPESLEWLNSRGLWVLSPAGLANALSMALLCGAQALHLTKGW